MTDISYQLVKMLILLDLFTVTYWTIKAKPQNIKLALSDVL